MGSSLNFQRRARELETLGKAPVDLLVIGGGVTGAGVALDAASRGLSVVLAEKHDLAFGTSRWSSKLIHGGLRYLLSADVRLARLCAAERAIMMGCTASHLVRPLTEVVPLLPSTGWRVQATVRGTFAMGDVLRLATATNRRLLGHSRRLSPDAVTAYIPGVRQNGLRGGIAFDEGQLLDDARLTICIARTAASFGANILTRMEATQATGKGARLLDRTDGRVYDVDARAVINATGVWAADLAPSLKLRPTRGSHLVLSRAKFPGLKAALLVPDPRRFGRVVYALPAPDGRVYVGLTDEDDGGNDLDFPAASEAEITFLIETINLGLQQPVARADVLGTFSGLRPLFDTGGDGGDRQLSRRHVVVRSPDGLVSVVGGKLTIYRKMAQDAVDAALEVSGQSALPCRTSEIRLVGAADSQTLAAVAAPGRLVRTYGTEAPAVLAYSAGDAGLLEPLGPGTSVTAAELLFGVEHEGALSEDDLLDRRTRLGLVKADRDSGQRMAQLALKAGGVPAEAGSA
jgi:glycerol-3-phosphate dehydrogenase